MLILASQSPRRRELLQAAGIPFQIRVSPVEEKHVAGESPEAYVLRLSRAKAEAAGLRPGETVLGADTVVVLDGHILEKPVDYADACRMLRMLSGRDHAVITGVCLISDSRVIQDSVTTRVVFGPLSDREIEEYAASGEPMDKAGAYAIQGLASKFIERIEGDYTNVVGLPVPLLYRMLRG
ncbi:MAG: Maf family protein [Bryobacteraceae bacterium]|nr:Maf family protein [Bryobacteraceae bacterium]